MKVLVALMLGFMAIGVGVAVAPQAHAATPPRQPDYIQCSSLYGWVEFSAGSAQDPGSLDGNAYGYIRVWYDAHNHSLVCQEQARVQWTTSYCPSGRKLDVYFTNGVGGDNSTQLQCTTQSYFSKVTYSDACTYYVSARTTDSYQVSWPGKSVC
jgi:hypothetical protein